MEKKGADFTFGRVVQILLSLIGIAVVCCLMWYFRFLVGCFCIAIIISFWGRPIMRFLEKIHYKRFQIGTSLAAFITLMGILFLLGSLIYFGVPALISEAMTFSNIDVYQIADYYADPIAKLENVLLEYGLIHPGDHMETMVSSQIMDVLKVIDIKIIAGKGLNFLLDFGMGFFIVLFIAFFLLKDVHLLRSIIDAFVPDKYMKETNAVLKNIHRLISRYFIGLGIEILCVTGLLSLGFWFMGFHSALLLGFIGGITVILPYIGVIIGGALGLMLCITGFLSIDPSISIVPVIVKFLIVFAIVKLFDDFVLQPLIYSRSVKAHPLEIFCIILISGKIAGIPGMISAIPVYTILRIVAKEFFSTWKIVKRLTAKI